MKKNIKITISNGAAHLIHILQANGYSAYICGGAVRDSILGRPIHDWDICTSATPDEMLLVFKDKKVIETGLKHGTITVVVDDIPYEVTTFRTDGNYSDNRRPDKVTFINNVIEDLRRRDFTINAMAYNDEEGLVDPFNGLEDIKSKKIRCVGSAKERFEEDALRILRAIRFSSQLEFEEDRETIIEIHHQYKSLEKISIERINNEFCKIISTKQFYAKLLLYPDVFSLFIPELKSLIDFPQNNPHHAYDVFGHTVHAMERCESEDLIVRLAVFFHDFGKPHSYQDGANGIRHFKGHGRVSADITDSIMKRLRFDNDTRTKVVELIYYHDATFKAGKKYIKRWLNKIGQEQFKRLMEVRRSDIKGQKPDYKKENLSNIDTMESMIEEVLQDKECFSLKELAVNGHDVKDIMMLKEGKDVGYWLNEILKRVINGDLDNNKRDLTQWLTNVKNLETRPEYEK